MSPKIICNFQKKEDSRGPARQREDSEQRHRGMKKDGSFYKRVQMIRSNVEHSMGPDSSGAHFMRQM